MLTIGYTLAEHQMYTTVWFPSEDACWNVLLSVGGFYDQINATEGHCDVSEVASNSKTKTKTLVGKTMAILREIYKPICDLDLSYEEHGDVN